MGLEDLLDLVALDPNTASGQSHRPFTLGSSHRKKASTPMLPVMDDLSATISSAAMAAR